MKLTDGYNDDCREVCIGNNSKTCLPNPPDVTCVRHEESHEEQENYSHPASLSLRNACSGDSLWQSDGMPVLY